MTGYWCPVCRSVVAGPVVRADRDMIICVEGREHVVYVAGGAAPSAGASGAVRSDENPHVVNQDGTDVADSRSVGMILPRPPSGLPSQTP